MSLVLYHPVGFKELQLIAESGFMKFPPRLPDQPIFYPVLSREYAEKIARDWNSKDKFSGYVGAVAMFDIYDGFAQRYPVHEVGGYEHRELWIPANELEHFNSGIVAWISILKIFLGKEFDGEIQDIISYCGSFETIN